MEDEFQHAKFGKGKILEIIGDGKDTELKVKFIDLIRNEKSASLLCANYTL